MFDCHAHLTDASLAEDLDRLLQEAEDVGVKGVVVVSEHLEDAPDVLDLCTTWNDRRRPIRLHPAIGMHPEWADTRRVGEMIELINQHAGDLVCVGEVGLDFSPHVLASPEHSKEIQREVLALQARRAQELGLAVNVHSRSAGHHAITLLREVGVQRALLHAFDGRPRYAEEAAQAGYHFSVPPIVCRSPGFQKLVKSLPLESLVLETDCPALAPEKNTRNEPRNLAVACQWVADLKGIPVEVVRRVTTQNAQTLFPRAFPGPLAP